MTELVKFPWKTYDDVFRYPNITREVRAGKSTRAELESLVRAYVEWTIEHYSNYIILDLALLEIENGLPLSNGNTNTAGLFRQRIPSGIHYETHKRFLGLYLYEISLSIDEMVETEKKAIVFNQAKQKYELPNSSSIEESLTLCGKRAVMTADTMAWFETNMPTAATMNYVEFIRNSAMVQFGEQIGVKIQTSTTPVQINVHTDQGIPTYETMPANSTIYVNTLNGLSNVPTTDANSRGATLTGVNGASLIHTRTFVPAGASLREVDNPDHLLNQDATYQLTIPLQIWGVRATPIQVPTIKTALPDISLAATVTESVNLANVFDGTRITKAVESSDTSKATVRLNETQTSMGVTGVAEGKATVTVTGSNESGEVTDTFVVTVTAAPSGD